MKRRSNLRIYSTWCNCQTSSSNFHRQRSNYAIKQIFLILLRKLLRILHFCHSMFARIKIFLPVWGQTFTKGTFSWGICRIFIRWSKIKVTIGEQWVRDISNFMRMRTASMSKGIWLIVFGSAMRYLSWGKMTLLNLVRCVTRSKIWNYILLIRNSFLTNSTIHLRD